MHLKTRIELNDRQLADRWPRELLNLATVLLENLPEPDKFSGNDETATFYWWASPERYAGRHVSLSLEFVHDDTEPGDPDNCVCFGFAEKSYPEPKNGSGFDRKSHFFTVLDHDYDYMNYLIDEWLIGTPIHLIDMGDTDLYTSPN